MSKISINIATGSLNTDDFIVGIDLGTTNSLIAIIHPENKKPVVLKEYDGVALVPSVIYFDEYNNPVIGDAARIQAVKHPERTIFSVKRLMGKSYNDVKHLMQNQAYKIIDDGTDSLVKVQVGDTFYSPVELSAFILKELKQRGEHILKAPVTKAVITVPAYFNDAQRQATRDAGKLAGLDVLRIINEPTAASLAYGLDVNREELKTIAVYDLGGGTFDVSVLRLIDGVFEVLSTHGNTQLGGDDIDNGIVQYWQENNPALQQLNRNAITALRLLAEKAKKTLGENEQYETVFEQQQLSINRTALQQIVQPIIEQTLQSCRQALKDAGLQVQEIDEVVMVGGPTRMQIIKDAVSGFFNKKLNDSLNPDEVVALGAAIQADILAGNNKDLLLLDVTPLSLGIETYGGLMDVLIPRNSKIPSRAGRQYTTQVDGQPGMRISVYQGERDLVMHNRKLAEFNLKGIPGMPAGLPKVDISFLVNADGILQVRAKELRSGVEQVVEVTPQYGLTDAEVEKMLLDSVTHAKEDIQTRALVEATAEAEQLIIATRNFIDKNTAYLTGAELEHTQTAIDALKAAIADKSKDLIQAKTTELNEISKPYAERLMDEAIAKAMKGKNILE